jgi:hypothetical protein
MPVLVDCATVVVRNATVEARFPDGVAGFERRCPNSTFCTDGLLCRVSFMHLVDAAAFIDYLGSLGFVPPSEIALIQMPLGPLLPCAWLHVAEADLEGGAHSVMAWLVGTDSSRFVAPPGWEPGAHSFDLTQEDLKRDYELVSIENGVETRRHRTTGQLIYQGRPRIPRGKRWWQFWK